MEELKTEIKQIKLQIIVGIDQDRIDKTWGKIIINNCDKALTLCVVSQQSELFLGFQKSEWFDLYEQGVLEYKDAIEKYLT